MRVLRPRNEPVTLEWILSKTTKNGDCLEWSGSIGRRGYPTLSYKGKTATLSRVVVQVATGMDPSGFSVLHSCDNPKCVNPAHLRIGTTEENAKDRSRRGRSADRKGEKHPNSKLTAELVMLARRERSLGKQIRQLARELGVSESTLTSAVNGETWKHLPR